MNYYDWTKEGIKTRKRNERNEKGDGIGKQESSGNENDRKL